MNHKREIWKKAIVEKKWRAREAGKPIFFGPRWQQVTAAVYEIRIDLALRCAERVGEVGATTVMRFAFKPVFAIEDGIVEEHSQGRIPWQNVYVEVSVFQARGLFGRRQERRPSNSARDVLVLSAPFNSKFERFPIREHCTTPKVPLEELNQSADFALSSVRTITINIFFYERRIFMTGLAILVA